MRIEISDDLGKALEAQAAAQGLTVETWLKELVAEMPSASRTPREAAAGILELQKFVKPDPEGWTVGDYINFGRR
jgi:hypothetical protein